MRTSCRAFAVLAVAVLAVTIAPAVNDQVRNVETQTESGQLKEVALAHFADPDPVPLPMPVEPQAPQGLGHKVGSPGSSGGSAIPAGAGAPMLTAEQRTERDIRLLIRKLD